MAGWFLSAFTFLRMIIIRDFETDAVRGSGAVGRQTHYRETLQDILCL